MARTLRAGTGKVLFRDYAENDLAHGRLGDAGKQQKLAPNFYVRGDGTRCFYFSEVRGPDIVVECLEDRSCLWKIWVHTHFAMRRVWKSLGAGV